MEDPTKQWEQIEESFAEAGTLAMPTPVFVNLIESLIPSLNPLKLLRGHEGRCLFLDDAKSI